LGSGGGAKNDPTEVEEEWLKVNHPRETKKKCKKRDTLNRGGGGKKKENLKRAKLIHDGRIDEIHVLLLGTKYKNH